MDVLEAVPAEKPPPPPQEAALQLLEVNDSATLRQIFALRVEAWKTFIHIDASHTEWKDEFETVSRHWAIFDGGMPVAAARLTTGGSISSIPDAAYYQGVFSVPPNGPVGSFTRMCVRPGYRGQNLSLQLDQVRLTAARQAGCRSIIVRTSAGDRRIGQLESIGFKFVCVGPPESNGPLASAPLPWVMLLQFPE